MQSLEIGIRGHDYGTYQKDSFKNFLSEISYDGFSNVQLVLWKLIDSVGEQLENLSPELLSEIKAQLTAQDIEIVNLGSYFNVVNPDLKAREKDIQRFLRLIEIASEMGFPRVGTETGSINSDLSYHPENHSEELFQEALSVIRRLVKHAEHYNVQVAIEGVEIFTVHDICSLKRMLDEIDSPNLKIIFDPVNLIGMKNHATHEALIRDAFATFGEQIELVHFKDFRVVDGELIRVPPGKGVLNYSQLLTLMDEYGVRQGVIEEISKEESKQALLHIRNLESKLKAEAA